MKHLLLYFLLGLTLAFNAQTDFEKQPKCKKIEGIEKPSGNSFSWKPPKDYTGIVKKCNKDKVILLQTYKDGKLNGLFITWHPNGQMASKGNYKNGKEDGLFRVWFPNGQLDLERNLKNGSHNGLAKRWHKNGQLKQTSNIDENGNGSSKGWHINGQLHFEEQFENGKKSGLRKVYYNNGKLRYEENYIDGSIVTVKCYDMEGNKIQCD